MVYFIILLVKITLGSLGNNEYFNDSVVCRAAPDNECGSAKHITAACCLQFFTVTVPYSSLASGLLDEVQHGGDPGVHGRVARVRAAQAQGHYSHLWSSNISEKKLLTNTDIKEQVSNTNYLQIRSFELAYLRQTSIDLSNTASFLHGCGTAGVPTAGVYT